MKKENKEGLLFNILFRIFNVGLLKNKFYSLMLMLLGYITMKVSGGNSTAFIFTLMFGLPIFFADKNVIN